MTEQCVFIVDDDEAMRDSLQWLIESQGLAVRTFAAAEDFLAACGDAMAGCIVLDVRMPGMSGLELYEKMNLRRCTLPVIFITGHGDVPMAVSALKKGAVDFIEKPFNDKELLRVIGQCLERESATRQQRQREGEAARRLAGLTEREREVMDLILAGKLNKQIAHELGVGETTVKAHVSEILRKLDVASRTQAVIEVSRIDFDKLVGG